MIAFILQGVMVLFALTTPAKNSITVLVVSLLINVGHTLAAKKWPARSIQVGEIVKYRGVSKELLRLTWGIAFLVFSILVIRMLPYYN